MKCPVLPTVSRGSALCSYSRAVHEEPVGASCPARLPDQTEPCWSQPAGGAPLRDVAALTLEPTLPSVLVWVVLVRVGVAALAGGWAAVLSAISQAAPW